MIDSALNTVDEGFDKSPENGFEISLIGEHDRLISFFRNYAGKQAVWSISYDKDTDRLLFVKPRQEEKAAPVVALDPRGRLGVNTSEPKWSLDVSGVVAAQGRIGANPDKQKTVPADGEWHNITAPLTGCQAFEVMAGVGNKGTGKYALMQAVALNTFNPRGPVFNFFKRKNRVKYNQAYYLSRGHKIKLRWFGKDDNYHLQMRTNCNYGKNDNDKDILIRYYLTQLWFDETMEESWADRSVRFKH
ncbi:MAG: hypothetical protein ABFS39_09640 [Pseudomonadota bacterium]